MFYINSDPHGNYAKIEEFCFNNKLNKNDTIVLLGDVAVNYFGDNRDFLRKNQLAALSCKFLCIHGNHEMRPEHLSQYQIMNYCGGNVWIDYDYPNVMFAKDGEIYNLDNHKCIVIGGAYSVDKQYRLLYGYQWFEDEQPSENIKKYVEDKLIENSWNIDYILSHTSPLSYEPIEVFISGLDQSKIDKSTEIWLENIENKTTYKKWYIGHYHTDKVIDNIRFVYDDFIELGK
jgi:DNA repair exonuclease SbcCD nuclease subunit